MEESPDAKAMPMTRRVEIIDKKEFATAALNEDDETSWFTVGSTKMAI